MRAWWASPIVAAAFHASVACAISAADEPLDSPKLYFSYAQFASVGLSPSGERIAAISPVNGRRSLVVIDLATRKSRVAATVDRFDVFSFQWVNDKRLVFNIFDLQAPLGVPRGTGLFAVDHDGSAFEELSWDRRRYVYAGIIGALDDGSDDVLILASDITIRSQSKLRYPDVFRLNTRSGQARLLTPERPGDPLRWVADAQGVVRAVVTTEKGVRFATWWRPSADSAWRKIGESDFREPSVVPVAFEGDGTLLVTSNVGRDAGALYRFDTQKMALDEMLAAHPYASMNGVLYDRRKSKVVGVRYDDGKPGYAWFDDDWARIAAMVDKALPNAFNELSPGAGDRLLVYSHSDVNPGTWYLLDTASRKLEFLLASRPSVQAERMPARQFVRYRARDGMQIPAYLTLPKGRDPKGLPLVVLVHGGPFMRGAHWTWDDEPAFLANLGYAVLQPEFRGSAGWGGRHFRAGWKQWGLAMQDDLNDGIDWLAANGTIDPKRVCIMGASYGGYAVMLGLARDPERFRCGINLLGVTDLTLMLTAGWSDTAHSDFANYGVASEMIGDPDRDAARFNATSPLTLADRIKAPVLMAYGGSDVRVPVDHGVRMRNAIRRNGGTVEWIEYPEEAHGFRLESTRFDFYGRVAKFLAEHLPAK